MFTHSKLKTFALILFLNLVFFPLSAQVTIGSNKAPVPGALLDLKEHESSGTDQTTAVKGLALPRVQLSDLRNLYPMFKGDTDY